MRGPGLAFDSEGNHYLVVWAESNGSDRDIKGRFLDGTGAPAAAEFDIATGANEQTNPDTTFDPVNNRFLMVWENDTGGGTGFDIYGRLTNSDGTFLAAEFAIAEATGDQSIPRTAYDPATQRYLVVWQLGTGNGADVRGQLVNTDGTLFDQDGNGTPDTVADNIDISITGSAQLDPAVTFDPTNNRFLVVWGDNRTPAFEIFGQMVNPEGTLFGPDSVTNFQVSDAATVSPKRVPNVAFNSATGGYQATWQDNNNATYYRPLNADSTFPMGSGMLTDQSSNEGRPSVAANPYCANFLAAWMDSGTVTPPYAQELGSCAPNPGLLWPNQVREPTSVTSGATATFTVTYSSNSNTPPTQAQLWIDLDGDGEFSAATTGSPGGGFNIFAGNKSLFSAFAAMLALLALFAIRPGGRHPGFRPIGSPLVALLAVGIISSIGVAGCGGSSGGGASEEETTETTAERYDMAAVSGSDGIYSNGETYTLDLQIDGAARNVTFRFVFSDGTTDAAGDPAVNQTLTVQ